LQAFLGEKMYAIVNIAGKQYKVAEGNRLKVARLSSKVGGKVDFTDVMLTDDGKNVKVGTPALKGASVTAEVLEHGRHRKILVYKKKRRKGYQRKSGHKQDYSLIQVKSIKISSTEQKKSPTKSKSAPKTTSVKSPVTKTSTTKKTTTKKTPVKKTSAKSTKKETK
jgi:large subunit ribosomal protein L21